MSASVFVHVLLCYIFTIKMDLGVSGVSLATIATTFLYMTLVMIYAWRFSEFKIRPVPRNTRALLAWYDLSIYMAISLPSIAMVCAEWWGTELVVVMAA